MIFDRDAKYGLEVLATLREMGMESLRTSRRGPWQNGVAEHWVGSCRRELLDHVILANERHLRRLLTEYVRYFHEDCTHQGLSKGTPNEGARSVLERSSHDRDSVVYTTDTIGLHSFRDRTLLIYRVWAFISGSACVGENSNAPEQRPPVVFPGRPHVREESPD